MQMHQDILTVVFVLVCPTLATKPPHIVLIIADDLGWNDVGFHGMNHIPTPNLDALAASGVVLQRHYVTPICTPSRAALVTGKYPIHTGMQHGVLYGQEPRGLPLSEKILPQYLKELGYRTHLVGKWHLGSFKKNYLPLHRGFESHTGFWTGKIDMYDHTNMEKGSWGYDFRRGFATASDLFGKYATDIYTEEAVKIIREHNATQPLFLMVAHSAVHTGNPCDPIRAPSALVDTFRHINDSQRQKFAGVLSAMDSSVGSVVSALQSRGLLRDTVLVFSTDNGGAPQGFNLNAGSNYPLRGTKGTLWEGGVRGASFLWSPLLEKRSRAVTTNVHLVDWLPTLYGLAGGNTSTLKGIDGVDIWGVLSRGDELSDRPLLLNIDSVEDFAGLIHGDWKIVQGTTYTGAWDSWFGPSGREGEYVVSSVLASPAGRALQDLHMMPTAEHILDLRKEITVNCDKSLPEIKCNPLTSTCLFNVRDDPCERHNLASEKKEKLEELLSELSRFRKSEVPPNNKPLSPSGDPKLWGRVFINFQDYARPPLMECLS